MFENWKLSLGISLASLAISLAVLIIVLAPQSYAPQNTLTRYEKEEIPAPEPDKVFRTQTMATHKKLRQAAGKDKELLPQESKLTGSHVYLTFDVNTLPSEYSNGVTVTSRSLIIRIPGLYYLYSSICFHTSDKRAHKTDSSSFVKRVSPHNPGVTGVLLKSVYTGVENTTATKFTGGIFLLQEGDRIQVLVSDSNSVDDKCGSTYVGMLPLGKS